MLAMMTKQLYRHLAPRHHSIRVLITLLPAGWLYAMSLHAVIVSSAAEAAQLPAIFPTRMAEPSTPPQAPSSLTADLTADPLFAKALNAALVMQRLSWEQGVLSQYYVEVGDIEMQITTALAMVMRANKDCVAARGGSTVDPLMAGECLHLAAMTSKDPGLMAADQKMLAFARAGAKRSDAARTTTRPGFSP